MAKHLINGRIHGNNLITGVQEIKGHHVAVALVSGRKPHNGDDLALP